MEEIIERVRVRNQERAINQKRTINPESIKFILQFLVFFCSFFHIPVRSNENRRS